MDGNRDGGDSEQQTKPPITQPAPDIPDTPPAQDTASGSVAVPDTEPFFMAPQDIQEPATELPVETEALRDSQRMLLFPPDNRLQIKMNPPSPLMIPPSNRKRSLHRKITPARKSGKPLPGIPLSSPQPG